MHYSARRELSSGRWNGNKRTTCVPGTEGTFSQGVRSMGLRHPRYRGQAKTHLQNLAIACAINLQRITDYWSGVLPAQTRTPTFAQLGQWIM